MFDGLAGERQVPGLEQGGGGYLSRGPHDAGISLVLEWVKAWSKYIHGTRWAWWAEPKGLTQRLYSKFDSIGLFSRSLSAALKNWLHGAFDFIMYLSV